MVLDTKMQSSLLNNAILFLIVATLIAVKPSPDPRELVFELMTRDLAKISDWWSLWGMKLNLNKTQSMIVSRCRTLCTPITLISS